MLTQLKHCIDRRRETRRSSCRAIAVMTGGVAARFNVRNISAHGVAGICDLELFVGQYVSFHFENGERFLGQVRWLNGSKSGIYFSQPLPAHVVSGAPARASKSPRPPRFSTKRHAIVGIGLLQEPALIRNVSTGGMMIETALPLDVRQEVSLSCGEMTLLASVRWGSDSRYGLQLREPINLAAFEELSRRAVCEALGDHGTPHVPRS